MMDTFLSARFFLLLSLGTVTLGVVSRSVSGQTWWEYQSHDDAVWTEVTNSTGVLWLVKGINDVGDPDTGQLTQCQNPQISVETGWVLRSPEITFANGSYAGIKTCGQDDIGWLIVVESEDYVTPGFKPNALAFGDTAVLKCGDNAMLCIDVHIVETEEDLPPPPPPWYDIEVTFESNVSSVDEGIGIHNVTVNLSHASPEEGLSLSYDLGGSAVENTDYRITNSGNVFVAAELSSVDIPITIIDDDVIEEDETIELILTSQTGYTVGSDNIHTLTIEDNDEPVSTTVTLAAFPKHVEEGNSVRITATISLEQSSDVEIPLEYIPVAPYPATADDYRPLPIIIIPAGELAGVGDLHTIDDDFYEEDETFTVAIVEDELPEGVESGSLFSEEITIINNDSDPPVQAQLSVDPRMVEEGESIMVRVELAAELSSDVEIPLEYIPVAPYPATADDYHPLPIIIIPAGELAGVGDLHTIDDDFYEEDETFTVAIVEDELPEGVESGSLFSEEITIINNDSDPPVQAQLSVDPRMVEEGESIMVRVELAAELSTDVTIPLTLTDVSTTPQDYEAPIPTQIEIESEETGGTYVILTVEDEVDEGNETFVVAIDKDQLPEGIVTGSSFSVEVTITDDDKAGINAPPSVSVPEGGMETFDMALNSEPLGEVTVEMIWSTGTDLMLTPQIRTFTPDNWDQTQQVTLSAIEDPDIEDDQIVVTLTAIGVGYTGIAEMINVTIKDNDLAGIVSPASVTIPEGGSERFEVALAQQPSGVVTVTVPSPVGDLIAVPSSLTFTPDNWQTSWEVTLSATEDDDFISDFETFTLSAGGGGYGSVTREMSVTIIDNDEPEIMALEDVTMDEGGTYPLMVRLTAKPSESVTVGFTGHVGTDLTLSGIPLTFTSTNWQVPQMVTLTAAEDDTDYVNDRVELVLTASGGGYDTIHTTDVTIIDNDEAPLIISVLNRRGIENEESLKLRIELNRSTDEVVTVNYTSSDVGEAEAGLDYTASRGIVIFDPGATRGVIEIKIIDDELPEKNETFNVTLLNASENAQIGRGTGIGTILDDDGSAKIRVEDALVLEEEAVVRFPVSLSQPQRKMVSAEYQTQDGTARAGKDYESTSGIVTFAPGTMEAVIAVPLLKDGLGWQEETFSVHLVSAKYAEISKAVGVATIRESAAVGEDILEAYVSRFVRTVSVQVVEALGYRFRSIADGATCGAAERAEMAQLWYSASSWNPSLGELLAGCRVSQSMSLPRGSFSVWGEGAFKQFNGRGEDALTLSGEVTTGMLGADYRWNNKGRWLAGVLLAHNGGDGSFEVAGQSGDITAGLTGVYPYMSYARTGWDVWVSAGTGRGQADVLELEGDLVSRFGAIGVRGALARGGAVGISYYGDILVTDAEIKDHNIKADVHRVRAGLEANTQITNGIRPYVEVSVRQDGGSAETGTGLELGGGLRFSHSTWYLLGEVRTQGLVMHTADEFTEWGISGSLQVGSRSEGLMIRLRPSWGRGQGMSVYGQQTILDTVPLSAKAHRTELEVGYGIPWGDGTVRSVMGLIRLPQGSMYRLGGEFRPWDRLAFSVFGLAHERGDTLGDIGMSVQGSFRY